MEQRKHENCINEGTAGTGAELSAAKYPAGSSERIRYFDTWRFLAAMLIFVTHYINAFAPELFYWFYHTPTTVLFGGLSGKLGVAMLCVILGYFAYRKGLSTEHTTLTIFVQRYLHFVITAIVFYLIAGIIRYQYYGEGFGVFVTILRDSFLLRYEHNVLFWCLEPLLFGSGIGYILGKTRAKEPEIIISAVIMLGVGQVWIFGCVIGTLLYVWKENGRVDRIMRFRAVRLLLFAVPFALTHQNGNENYLVYIIDNLFCFFLVLVTMYSPGLQKILNSRIWTPFSGHYFGIFIFHTMVYETAGAKILHTLTSLPFGIAFLLAFCVSFACTVIVSIPVNAVITWCDGGIGTALYWVEEKIRSLGKRQSF